MDFIREVQQKDIFNAFFSVKINKKYNRKKAVKRYD